MAKRYSGDLQINVIWDDRGFYRTSVSQDGKSLWSGTVGPVERSGIAKDSPQSYDDVASAALSFADDEIKGIGDDAEFTEDLSDWLIRRKPREKMSGHATKKRPGPAFQAGDCVTMRESHRKYLTSSTGGTVFKVVSVAENALTLEGPLDWHPEHRRREVMGAQQFKRIACPRFGDARDGDGHEAHEAPRSHATRPQIVVNKIGGRWQPVNTRGTIIRGNVYNARGEGYSTRQSAEEAASMIRRLGKRA
jgi:hypothetical protein